MYLKHLVGRPGICKEDCESLAAWRGYYWLGCQEGKLASNSEMTWACQLCGKVTKITYKRFKEVGPGGVHMCF